MKTKMFTLLIIAGFLFLACGPTPFIRGKISNITPYDKDGTMVHFKDGRTHVFKAMSQAYIDRECAIHYFPNIPYDEVTHMDCE